ncbi:hypothetical protein ASG42_28495 [Rhizobium sp. Leaf391]|nr:hypothetical protein ASG42_28495 [Rhizobium sp. Leaf391]
MGWPSVQCIGGQCIMSSVFKMASTLLNRASPSWFHLIRSFPAFSAHQQIEFNFRRAESLEKVSSLIGTQPVKLTELL